MDKRASSLAARLMICTALATGGSLTARGQDKAPGLTGIDRADEVVMARQLVMDGIEDEMMAIETGPSGKELALGELKAHASSAIASASSKRPSMRSAKGMRCRGQPWSQRSPTRRAETRAF